MKNKDKHKQIRSNTNLTINIAYKQYYAKHEYNKSGSNATMADRLTRMRMGSVMNLLVISRISCGRVAEMRRTWVAGGR